MDAETQTDSMDVSDPDLSPTVSSPSSYPELGQVAENSALSLYPQRVILQEFRNDLEEEAGNGNCVQLHYMESNPKQSKFYLLN